MPFTSIRVASSVRLGAAMSSPLGIVPVLTDGLTHQEAGAHLETDDEMLESRGELTGVLLGSSWAFLALLE